MLHKYLSISVMKRKCLATEQNRIMTFLSHSNIRFIYDINITLLIMKTKNNLPLSYDSKGGTAIYDNFRPGTDILKEPLHSQPSFGRSPAQRTVGNMHSRLEDKASKYARDAEQFSQAYQTLEQSGELQQLDSYFRQRNYEKIDITGLGSGNLGDALAGCIRDEKQGYLMSNGNIPFEQKVLMLAQKYGVSERAARDYLVLHEISHAYQKISVGYDSPEMVEKENEKNLADYCNEMLETVSDPKDQQRYSEIKSISEQRMKELEFGHTQYSNKPFSQLEDTVQNYDSVQGMQEYSRASED